MKDLTIYNINVYDGEKLNTTNNIDYTEDNNKNDHGHDDLLQFIAAVYMTERN